MFMPLMLAMTNCTRSARPPMRHQFGRRECAGLTRDQIGLRAKHPLNCLVCDVSFIRLSLVLPPAMSLLVSGGWMVALIKPQFEAGRAAIGKNGVVSDPACMRACAMTLPHGSPRHFLTGRGTKLFQARLSGRKAIRNFCSVLVRRTINQTPEIYSMSADQAPRAASPFILARWANAACAVAVFSALPPQA